MLDGVRRRLGREQPEVVAPEAPGPPFYEVLRDVIASAAPVQRVAVLPGLRGPPILAWIAELAPDADVHTYPPDLDASERLVRMSAEGRFDLIVDTTIGKGRYGRARDLLMQTTAGGVVVLRALPAKVRQSARKKRSGQDRRELAQLLAGVAHATIAKSYAKPGKFINDTERLAHVLDSVDLSDGHVVIRSAAATFAKIREEEIDEILALKGESWGRVCRRIEAVDFVARGEVRQSASEFASPVAASYAVPPLALREYHDVVCRPGQIVVKDNLILPDAFRHNQKPRYVNGYLVEVGPSFALVEDGGADVPLSGDYFYLDDEFRGHFGHMLTEVLSRLWAWRDAKAEAPDLKALMFMNKNRHLADFEVRLFEAAGIDRDDIVFSYEGARVERLWAATPMFSHPAYVHPDLAELWGSVSDRLALEAPDDLVVPRRFFVSRRLTKRPCHNQQEVEELFSSHGFTVLFPEDYPLETQVVMFRNAEVIAGFAGSGMFNLAFSKSPKHVIVVSSESYTATNEHMMAAVVGHRLDVARLRSDGERNAAGGWLPGSFHKGFTYEPDAPGGRFLREVLASLEDGSGAPDRS